MFDQDVQLDLLQRGWSLKRVASYRVQDYINLHGQKKNWNQEEKLVAKNLLQNKENLKILNKLRSKLGLKPIKPSDV